MALQKSFHHLCQQRRQGMAAYLFGDGRMTDERG